MLFPTDLAVRGALLYPPVYPPVLGAPEYPPLERELEPPLKLGFENEKEPDDRAGRGEEDSPLEKVERRAERGLFEELPPDRGE